MSGVRACHKMEDLTLPGCLLGALAWLTASLWAGRQRLQPAGVFVVALNVALETQRFVLVDVLPHLWKNRILSARLII